MKLAVIGGGSSYTPELIEGILKRSDRLPVSEIYLVDIEAGIDKLNIIEALTNRMINAVGSHIKVVATLDRREAIKDADFVLTQFRVGGLAARALDERIPLKYMRIGQETTGVGGFAKALRTIPVILDICADIEELAPNAWMLNFTNPAGMVTEAVLNHTKVKAIGLCNVPVSMRMMIAEMLQCEPKKLTLQFAGLNHLVYVKQAILGGVDVTADVLRKISEGENFTMKNIHEAPWDVALLNSLEVIPCPYHRYFYQTTEMLHEELDSASDYGTRAEQVMVTEKELFELYQDVNLDHKPEQLEQRGGAYYSDASLNLVDAIHNNLDSDLVVNVHNNGTLPFLADNAVIECSAFIGKGGATSEYKDVTFVPQINELVATVKAYEIATIDAAINGDYQRALDAFQFHPLIDLNEQDAKGLLNDIIDANKDYVHPKLGDVIYE